MTQTIFSGNLAGIQYADPNFNDLSAEDAIGLIPEPQSKFDPHAIRVSHSVAGRLGYIPATSCICINQAKANGFIPVGKIVSANCDGKYPKIVVVVTIEL